MVEPLRVTPAGVPICEGLLHYEAKVTENGVPRVLSFDMAFLAMGEVARSLQNEALGTVIEASGFIAPKTLKISRLVMHITDYKKGA